MPAALTMNTTLIARRRDDDIIRLKATDLDIVIETKISEAESLKGKLKWGDYQLGVALELMKDGYEICGCDLLYDDTVPHGGGLSSSAAIEVSTALCFATLSNEAKGITKDIDMIEMALVSQRAEHNFIGVNAELWTSLHQQKARLTTQYISTVQPLTMSIFPLLWAIIKLFSPTPT